MVEEKQRIIRQEKDKRRKKRIYVYANPQLLVEYFRSKIDIVETGEPLIKRGETQLFFLFMRKNYEYSHPGKNGFMSFDLRMDFFYPTCHTK